MKSFPMFIKTTGRRVVIAGGGEQAAQKVRLILKTDAQITILADVLDDELQQIVDEGRARHNSGAITQDSFRGAAMVFIASGCVDNDVRLHAIAKSVEVAVNVVDQPALCDITTPSLVDRDPVIVAIGTEGTAPVLGRAIKTQIEQILDPSLGSFAALAGRLRGSVAARIPHERRRAFWAWAFKGAPFSTHKRGAQRDAARILKDAIQAGSAPLSDDKGSIALVGAGPGARDLLTLRAVERLQEADVIFYDRLVDVDVLELARRDAERVFVGKVVGASMWPQDRISEVIVAAAKQGKRVVRLKSGDPMLFGRAAEELDAAEAAGICVEVVPGVTAASAAAAALKRPLSVRGETDTVVFCTGQARQDAATPDWAAYAQPGTSLAFYMSMGRASEIVQNLCGKGICATTVVCIAADVSKPSQTLVETTLENLVHEVQSRNITGCGILMVSLPKNVKMGSSAHRRAVA